VQLKWRKQGLAWNNATKHCRWTINHLYSLPQGRRNIHTRLQSQVQICHWLRLQRPIPINISWTAAQWTWSSLGSRPVVRQIITQVNAPTMAACRVRMAELGTRATSHQHSASIQWWPSQNWELYRGWAWSLPDHRQTPCLRNGRMLVSVHTCGTILYFWLYFCCCCWPSLSSMSW